MKLPFRLNSHAPLVWAAGMVLFAGLAFVVWDLGFVGSKVGPEQAGVTLSEREHHRKEVLVEEGLGTRLVEVSGQFSRGVDAGLPRVRPFEELIFRAKVSEDAGLEDRHETALAAAEKAEREDRVNGLRRRLLLEAAARALASPTPWSDLALVALGFQRAGDEESARYWFERASRLALDPDDAGEAARALREVVKRVVEARYFKMAIEIIARVPDAREKALARAELVKAYARSQRFEEARQLALELTDEVARGVALRSLAEAEARFHGLEEALTTLRMIGEGGDRDRALSSVASVRASMGDSDGAMTLLHKIQNLRLRDATVAKIASIQERGGVLSMEALAGLIHDRTFRDEILREVIVSEAGRLGIDLAVSSVTRIESEAGRAKAYESLVMLQIRQGDLDGALARAQAIRRTDARFRALQAVAVAKVQEGGARSARNIANLIGERELREVTYGKIAQRAAVYGQHREAVNTIGFIQDPIEKALAFATVALTQARYGLDRAALALVQDANRELERVGDERARARTQGVVAEVFAETGDAGAAMSAAAAIANDSLRDGAYQRVALSFAKVSKPVLATQSARLIERETVRERAFDSIAKTLASRVPFTQAVRFASSLDGHRQQVRFLLGVAGRKS